MPTKTLMRLVFLLSSLILALVVMPARSAVLTVCIEGSPDSMNPELTNSGTTLFVLDQIYDGLLSVEPGGSQVQPALAENWSVSDDGLVYTFKLRTNVAWQSNALFKPTRAMNADDVLFTFKRMMDASNPYHSVGGGNYPTFTNAKLADLIAKVEKTDDYTVVFTLKQPYAPFIGTMSHGSLAITSAEYADVLMKAGKQEQFDLQPIGTGPFRFQAYQTDSMVRLLPFPDTWGAKLGDAQRTPKVDAVVMAISTDATVRLQRTLAGECLIGLYPNLNDIKMIEDSGKVAAVRTPVPSVGLLQFNVRDDILKNKLVRQALSQAIDVKNLVDIVYSGLGHVTGSVVPPAMWGSDPDLKPLLHDPAKAKALLAQAGYPNGFKTDVWAIPVARGYMPNGRRAAEIIQSDFAAIGVQANIVSYEWAEYISRARAGEAKVGMFGGTYDFPDPSQLPNNYLTCDKDGKPVPSNIGGWCNAEFNALMAEASSVTDQKKREELYKKAQQIVHDDVAVVVLGSADVVTAVTKSVKGYVPAVFGVARLSGVSVE